MKGEANGSSRPDSTPSNGDRRELRQLEYEAQDMMPTRGPSLLRHSWQLLLWLPMLIALAGAILMPLISRGCAAVK